MKKIRIVGLGPGDAGLITVAAMQAMREAPCLLLRTAIHPSVTRLDQEGIPYEALDRFYEQGDSFAAVYAAIVEYVLQKAADTDVVYAVPGSPVVAEKTVQLLEAAGNRAEVTVEVLPGMSFLETLYTRLRLDPVNGLTVIDSSDIASLLPPAAPVIVTQIYDRKVASDVKLALMDIYGDEYEALLVYHISLPDEAVRPVKLYELDRLETIDHLTSLVLPRPASPSLPFDLTPLVSVMARLRGEAGCPWDKAQTHKSLRRYLLEEVYEMLDAVDAGDDEGICEELGDILYQVVIHARIGEERGLFSAQEIVDHVTTKMIRRHPHVFGEKSLENSSGSVLNWDRIKQGERRQRHQHLLDGVVKGMPALLESLKLQEKSAKVGFEWPEDASVWDKLEEELSEWREALGENDADHAEEEAGDVLFVLANLCRRHKIEPECALHRANSKFRRRFSHVEECVLRSQRKWEDYTLAELDRFWQDAKAIERGL
ncbi:MULTISPECIES: nucleoside triphosphate pyrophosphohydrolase [Megasphaera]|uniref:MazG family protein n=1 Tax=Megasphaera vaginalis (ex Srinivasan et al. 2021) TaxID=1111454 RepID=U7URH3_9FIRM|nr:MULTISPECIES: nucleoside triphosphate pyrophosphohydrolase [Megasphaera]ERT61886.1 MazG family protein [Megasphaera vaginalis (ex Srinivasan et al. 2021)]